MEDSYGALGIGRAYPVQTTEGYESAKMAIMPTLKQRMDIAVKQAEERLAAVKRAREILDKNPDLEELLNIMQRVNF